MAQGKAPLYLAELSQSIALWPGYVTRESTALFLLDRIWTLGDATVKDVNRKQWFQIVGKTSFTFQYREVQNIKGEKLFIVREILFPTSFYCEDNKGNRLLDILGNWSCKSFEDLHDVSY